MEVWVYAPLPHHPRLAYTLEVVLANHLGLGWRLTADRAAYLSAPGAHLNYSPTRLTTHELWLPPQGLLSATGLAPVAPDAHALPEEVFAHGHAKADHPCDLLAACFYWLSRYEEYLPFEPDVHGRFAASQSWQGRLGWLGRPVVQEWAAQLGAMLAARYPGLTLQPPAYRFLPTYDIDIPWAYLRRGWRGWARLGAALLRGRWAEANTQLAVWRGRQPDPYDTFGQLAAWHQQAGLRPVYFALMARRGRLDPGAPPDHRAWQGLLQQLAAAHPVGIHPSYTTLEHPRRLTTEIAALRAATGLPVQLSRQHFLRLRFPQTYQNLLAAGITADYSLGFADAPGFRAGTAVPFPWYDLSCETVTNLQLYPLTVMDATLRQYLGLEPAAAAAVLQQLEQTVRRHGGHFISLWHNSSFAPAFGWEGWPQIYRELLLRNASNPERQRSPHQNSG